MEDDDSRRSRRYAARGEVSRAGGPNRCAVKLYPPHEDADLDGSVYAKIARLIGAGKRVVDFGCSRGDLARFLGRQGCETFGVDINPEALEEARAYCTAVRTADLDVTSPVGAVEGRLFDVAVYADVLEHLRDPWTVLAGTHEVLADDGFVVASIPNIGHGAVILGLLEGRFDYVPLGILDNTHLRFFTRASALELFRRARFTVTGMDRTTLPLFGGSDLVPAIDPGTIPRNLLRDVNGRPDAETLQFVIRGHRRASDAPAFVDDEAIARTDAAPPETDVPADVRAALDLIAEAVAALRATQAELAEMHRALSADETAALKAAHADEMSAVERRAADERARHETTRDELKRCTTTYAKELERLAAGHAEALRTAAHEARARHELELAEAGRVWRGEAEEMRRSYERRLADQAVAAARHEAVAHAMTSTITLLREEIRALRKELSARHPHRTQEV